jgi:hypothetical protein
MIGFAGRGEFTAAPNIGGGPEGLSTFGGVGFTWGTGSVSFTPGTQLEPSASARIRRTRISFPDRCFVIVFSLRDGTVPGA